MKNIIFFAIMLSLLFAWGCAKKGKTEPEVVVVEEKAEKVLTPMEIYEQEYAKLPTSHTVVKGECLWWISEYKQIYNDPFMWPLIYKANRDQIKNPDLIYPEQTFSIPRDFTLGEAQDSRKEAGSGSKNMDPGPDAVVPASIRSQLGYGF